MANVAFQDAVSVADIAALKAIPSSDRASRSLRVVVSPGNNLPPTWYQFDADSTLSQLSPAIVSPVSGEGRWIMVGNPIYFAQNEPNNIPPIAGMRWVFGNRIWESTATNVIENWVELSLLGGSSGSLTLIHDPFDEGNDTEFNNVTTIEFKAGALNDLSNGVVSYYPQIVINDSSNFAGRINFSSDFTVTYNSNGGIATIELAS